MEGHPDVRVLLIAALEGHDGPVWWVGLAVWDAPYLFTPGQRLWWRRQPARARARWLLNELRGCQDLLPAAVCERWRWPVGTTIAQAVQWLRPTVE